MRRRGVALLTVGAAICAPSSAVAVRGLETGFGDGSYVSGDPGTRDAAFDRTLESGATLTRLSVIWSDIARAVPQNPRDPADPAYDFATLDAAISDAAERGLDVILTPTRAPAYAEGPGRPADAPAGTWKPDPAAFADFGAALATRYSGSFAGLPRVRIYQAWNEPNLFTFLTPQYSGKEQVSAERYREMLNAFYGAVKSVNSDNVVVTAGTAPYGDPAGGTRTRPLAFWRQLMCLRDRRKLVRAPCSAKASFDVLAHHPINTSGGPRRSAINPDDVATPDVENLRRVLRAGERRNTLATKGRHAIWATEVWWPSDPPSREGVSPQRQAEYLEEALYVLWKQGVSAVMNLQVVDGESSSNLASGSGLFFADGRPKPAFTAFRFPFVSERASAEKVRIWGRSPIAGELVVERRKKGWRALKRIQVDAGSVFTSNLAIRGQARLRARVGSETSLVWLQR